MNGDRENDSRRAPHEPEAGDRSAEQQPDRPTEEAGLPDRAEKFLADVDPTDQRGRPIMVAGFIAGIVLVLAILLLIGYVVL